MYICKKNRGDLIFLQGKELVGRTDWKGKDLEETGAACLVYHQFSHITIITVNILSVRNDSEIEI